MKIRCPICNQEYDVHKDSFGERAECEICNNKFVISRICLLDNTICFDDIDAFYQIDKELISAAFCNQNIKRENAVKELEGIAMAVAFDNKLDDSEIKLLATWIRKHHEYIGDYPFNKLYELLEIPVIKGITEEWKEKVTHFLKNISNEDLVQDIFDKSVSIEFQDHVFVVTGDFKNGMARSEVLTVIKNNGGTPSTGSVTKKTDYLIVGEKGSDAWRFGNYGRKIEKAIEYREKYKSPYIIKESDFLKYL